MAGRKRKTSLWIRLPLWGAAVVIVGWGLWQANEFHRNLMAEVHQNEVRDQQTTEIDPSANTLPPANELPEGLRDGNHQIPIIQSTPIGLSPNAKPDPLLQPLETHDERWEERAVAATQGTAGAASTAQELFIQGIALLNSGRVVDGRDTLNEALSHTSDENLAAQLRQVLSEINASVFLGSALLPEDSAARYIDIQSGDSFLKLAHTFNVPAAYLEQINPSLNPRNLKPLTGVKIVRGPFAIRVIKHAARMDLYVRDIFVRRFTVELPEGNYLPKGEYRIASETKLQLDNRTWIGFEGIDAATADVPIGWIYGSAGPRSTNSRDHSSGIHMTDADLLQLYNVLVETKSHLHVDP